MTAIVSGFQFTSTTGHVTSYLDLKNSDVISDTSTDYQNYAVAIPDTGETLSYEAEYRFVFNGSYTQVTGVHVWISSITSATGVIVSAGVTGVSQSAAPLNTYSLVINQDPNGGRWSWMSSTNYLDLTPPDTQKIDGAQKYSKIMVLQAAIDSTASPGDGFSAVYTVEWTES